MGILSARSTAYIFKYMGLDTLIVSIALLLLLLNIWVWFIDEPKQEIKKSRYIEFTNKIVFISQL